MTRKQAEKTAELYNQQDDHEARASLTVRGWVVYVKCTGEFLWPGAYPHREYAPGKWIVWGKPGEGGREDHGG